MSMDLDLLADRRFDPTPEQMKAKLADEWRAMLAAHEVERTSIAEQVDQLTTRLRSIDLCAPTSRHDETVIAIERINVAGMLDHKRARLTTIADVIAAHKKVKP